MAGNPNWKKGVSGNPGGEFGGQPKMKPWTQALKRALAYNEKTGRSDDLDLLAKITVAQAKAGDKDAISEIALRLEGRVPQPQVVTGDEAGGPVVHKHILGFKSDI